MHRQSHSVDFDSTGGSQDLSCRISIGQSSDTDDSTGEVKLHDLATEPPDRSTVENALLEFVGEIQQVPPQFSAVKVNGRRAYAKARAGEEVELAAKTVVVHEINVLDYNWPQLTLEIVCGSGTYIRSIARDLGERLNCGGLMSALVRTGIGKFDVATGTAPEDLSEDQLQQLVVDPINIVGEVTRYRCSLADEAEVKTGRPFQPQESSFVRTEGAGQTIALTNADGTSLLALAEPKGELLQPRQVFIT